MLGLTAEPGTLGWQIQQRKPERNQQEDITSKQSFVKCSVWPFEYKK